MKVILTGASGFIGNVLYRRLKELGWTVGLICRPQSQLEVFDGDTRFDYHGNHSDLIAAVDQLRPDVVIHLASCVLVDHGPGDVNDLIEANVTFPTSLLEAMAQCGVKRMVSAGTAWQHFSGDNSYRPTNLYAASKQAFTDICAYYCDAHAFQISELRLSDVYGPDDPRRKLMPLLVRVAKGELAGLDMTPGKQELDLIHVRDTAEAFVAAARNLMNFDEAGLTVYAVGSGQPVTLRTLVARIEEILGRKLDIRFGGRPYRDREVMKAWQGARYPSGWTTQYSLDDGLKDIFAGADRDFS